jgi:predicted GTPase
MTSASPTHAHWSKATVETQKKEASLSKWFREHLNTKKGSTTEKVPKGSINTISTSNSSPHNNTNLIGDKEDDDLADILREWIFVKTKVYVTILGEKGLGKSFLVNTLLESTFQDTHALSQHASLDKDFFLVADNKAKQAHIDESMQVSDTS